MRIFAPAALTLWAMLWGASTFANDAPTRWDAAERAKIVEDVGSMVRRHFAHWSATPRAEFERAFAEYRTRAVVAEDRKVFSALTVRLIASLRNGHTAFHDPELARDDPGNLGLRLIVVDGRWVVAASRRDEVPAGSVVDAIDGEPFDAFFRRSEPAIVGSGERARRDSLSFEPALFPRRFELSLADGRRARIDRDVALPPAVARPVIEDRWIEPGRVAYLRIGRFDSPEYETQARDAVRARYRDATMLVIDVRGNPGGTTPSRLGRELLGDDWRSWRTSPPKTTILSTTTSTATSPMHASRNEPTKAATAPRYLLLIDRGCGSACEDFAMPFSLSARALLIGESTWGSSGQPKIKAWDNGMRLWVGARRQWFPDGREFEGVGVAPDLPIPLRPQDFAAGAPDRVLDCALRIARAPTARDCE